jgi:hypothetical protein
MLIDRIDALESKLVKYNAFTGSHGYLSSVGVVCFDPQNVNYLSDGLSVTSGDKIEYTGDASGYWGSVFGYKENGTCVQLLGAGNFANQELIITDSSIMKIRAWNKNTVSPVLKKKSES